MLSPLNSNSYKGSYALKTIEGLSERLPEIWPYLSEHQALRRIENWDKYELVSIAESLEFIKKQLGLDE